MKLNERGLLVVLSGPSGVGKGTVRRALFQMPNHDLVYSVSMTTRAPRPGEVDGVDYYFVSKETFLERIKQNKFLEWAEFVGNYYGTPRDKVEEQLDQGKEVVLEIEVEGALQVRKQMKDAVFIFLVPPGKHALYERLKLRGTDTLEMIDRRMKKAESEFLLAHKYDYIVVNDEVNNAADRIMAIIRAEHAKTERTIHNYIKMIGEK
ncbi:MAG: guanylate kinase [Tenericutes bacterium GWC2_34_14]|nr:MAG: guanylate kinase [Tenericutes bacterium GWA2_35_7]OHE28942.1 MAG: guanylate kinase [Tenericutes bacterium GWC2_34_14]OHE33847.1 MAG: guanylate kinase [Tenericutes bacterium GWE2_34_108]OHE36582.1 MAG: guanylate kinase [Tenericutes bacterium GWF1_35_14]OHE37842.1 MAG: guanylate kinase [Tenericutes bacterium GWF2_35_184]OHE45297.1 MAG: guanylate kinase [Tenericutes bacterium RIFOXYA2_FULL_36_32]OHE45931.1 MAG: guanylate kinase [Tenericutes bacterium RIFOXYA12_FULL_35_10]OHE50135.1 MAG: